MHSRAEGVDADSSRNARDYSGVDLSLKRIQVTRISAATWSLPREEEGEMKALSTAHDHIDITETLVRLYVFLAQDVDRCLHEAEQSTYPEHDFHLSSTRMKMLEMLSVNTVVQGKVAQECTRVLALTA